MKTPGSAEPPPFGDGKGEGKVKPKQLPTKGVGTGEFIELKDC